MTAASGLMLACLYASALGQMPTESQRSAIRSACRADYEAQCPSVSPGGQAGLACLQRNITSLSPPCADAVGVLGPQPAPSPPEAAVPPALRRTKVRQLGRACRFDYREFCRGLAPGSPKALRCLTDHAEAVSYACRDVLSAN